MPYTELLRVLDAINTLRDFAESSEESVFCAGDECVVTDDLLSMLDVLADAIDTEL